MGFYRFIPINDKFFMVFEIIGINNYLVLIFFQIMGCGDSQMPKLFKN